MLDFNRIVGEVCGDAGHGSTGISKTASRNHYEWSLANGMRAGDRVRLKDGREGALTAPFPGCLGDGDWCGVFLDDGSEENIRPDRVASIGRKAADGTEAAPPPDAIDQGRSVRYVVEFRDHGTDHMSAKVTKSENGSVEGDASVGDHDLSSKLLQALVEFESQDPGGERKWWHRDQGEPSGSDELVL